MRPRRTRPDGERGSATLELVVLAPALLALIAPAIVTGRIATAYAAVESAARDAARQASLARDPAQARHAATTSATATLRDEHMRCGPSIALDTSGFSRQVGAPVQVTARVTCTLRLGDLLPGLPGHTTVRASFVAPIDPYRGRTLGLGSGTATSRSHSPGPSSKAPGFGPAPFSEAVADLPAAGSALIPVRHPDASPTASSRPGTPAHRRGGSGGRGWCVMA